jgi:transposase
MNAARDTEYTSDPVMFLALELSASKWKVGTTTGLGQKPREKTVEAGDLGALLTEIGAAKARFRLPEDARVISCYEAGRDGFWIHRWMTSVGIENVVIDPASVEVDRRKKKKKTDRLDMKKLLRCLIRWFSGEPKVWSVVRVPSVKDEDDRHLHRELGVLRAERTRHSNRIKSLLITHGVKIRLGKKFIQSLHECRIWDGSPLPEQLVSRLVREYGRWELVGSQILFLEKQRRKLLRESKEKKVEMVRQLQRLKAIGYNSSWLFVMEFFGWREFNNRKEVGSLAGLTGTPFNSGSMDIEQGIDKAGNPRVRSLAVEIAWCWLRFQPTSELSMFFHRKCGSGGKRLRRIAIVAMARKLLVALWRYTDQGVVPAGAILD